MHDRSRKSRQTSKQEIQNSTSGLERAFVLLFLPDDIVRTEAFSFTAHFRLVVGTFTEIKTGYRGFETNEIQYFICFLVCSKNI